MIDKYGPRHFLAPLNPLDNTSRREMKALVNTMLFLTASRLLCSFFRRFFSLPVVARRHRTPGCAPGMTVRSL